MTTMWATQKVKKVLAWHEVDDPGMKAGRARFQCAGKPGRGGSIFGRGVLEWPKEQAPDMLNKITDIRLGKA